MSRHETTRRQLLAPSLPANLKWSKLKGFLEHLGYEMLTGKGSRRKFYHKNKDLLIICHEPHPEPDVDKGCLAYVVEHLKDNGLLSEE